MADITADQHRSNIAQAFEAYITELAQAGPHWERIPAAGGEGEEAWSARQVAEHVAGASTFIGATIAMGLGVQGPERVQPSFASAGEAVDGSNAAHEKLVAVVNQMNDDNCKQEFEAPRFGKRPLGDFLAIVTGHLADHAAQLATLRTA